MRIPASSRDSFPEEHDDRRHARFVVRLTEAAAAVDASDARALAEEALPLDNEALALAEGCDPPAESREGPDKP